MLRLLEEKIATPLGPLWVICDEQFRLRAVEWEEYSERMVQLLDIHYRKESYERISATNLCDEQFRLRAVEWEEYSERMVQLLDIHYRKESYERISATNPGGLSDKLREYFAGNLSIIDTLPTATGGTPFQREVWKTLRTIPCGQVMHYGQLAEQLGRPGAARAVGAANGSNPISIVVPCHRVIGRNGTMTGYAGGVLRKEWLLRHEGYLLL
ncbi:methylated-DNA--[protein]-cysteine S-methyltransferase [Escherichia coli]|nr:methylated-DNA--[protein]-cysteine S-methyltransferase [Escherichia coli]